MVERPQPPTGRHLTSAEALMWSLDNDPALRSSFMGVTFLDSPPDADRFRRKMFDAVASINALRERVVAAPFDVVNPRWEIDPSFDLDYHVRFLALPAPGSRRQLLDLAALLYADPFDRARPLWQFTIVEGLEGGGAALLAKMHHVLSDGVGAIRLSMSFLDLAPDGASIQPQDPHGGDAPGSTSRSWFAAAAGALAPLLSASADLTRKSASLVSATFGSVARNPAEGVTTGLATARSIGRQLGLTDPARSPIWGQRSLTNRFDVLSLDLGRTRAAAKLLGGTVNDGFVTVMAAAAGDYHRALGTDVEQLRMTMPISVRRDRAAAGNAWVPARLLVPTAAMDIGARFGIVSDTLRMTKQEPSLNLGASFAGVVRRLPGPVVTRFAHQQIGTVDFACSNVRGAPFDLWIAGAKVVANHPLGPTAGVAFNATVLSYLDSLDLGLNTDTGAITRPDLLHDCVANAADELSRLT